MNTIVLVLQTAIGKLLDDPSALFRAIWPPFLMLVIGTALQAVSLQTAVLGGVLSFAGYILLAVTVHRYILAAELAANDEGLTKASLLYFLWLLGVGLATMFVLMPVVFLLLGIGAGPAVFLAAIPAAYITSRLSLVLPDRAIGRETELRDVWEISHGNGWKLALILVLLPIVISMPFAALQAVLPYSLGALVEVLVAAPLVVLNVALLSVAYEQLSDIRSSQG